MFAECSFDTWNPSRSTAWITRWRNCTRNPRWETRRSPARGTTEPSTGTLRSLQRISKCFPSSLKVTRSSTETRKAGGWPRLRPRPRTPAAIRSPVPTRPSATCALPGRRTGPRALPRSAGPKLRASSSSRWRNTTFAGTGDPEASAASPTAKSSRTRR